MKITEMFHNVLSPKTTEIRDRFNHVNRGESKVKKREKSTMILNEFFYKYFQSLLTAIIITQYVITCLKTFKPSLGFW